LVLAFEVTRVGKAMAAERGLKFTAAKTDEYVGGTLIGSTQFATGRFAMIDDGIGFQLVPWQPVLDKRIGQHITGIMGSAGGIEWSFGKETGVGAVSVPNIVTCSSPWGQPGDPVKALDCSSTARSWGWNRSTTSRRVKVWVASGRLGRTPGPDGRSVFTARTPDVPQARDAAAGLASPSAKSLVIPTVSLACAIRCTGRTPRGRGRAALRRLASSL